MKKLCLVFNIIIVLGLITVGIVSLVMVLVCSVSPMVIVLLTAMMVLVLP